MNYRDDPNVPWYNRGSTAPLWAGLLLLAVFIVAGLLMMLSTQDRTGQSSSLGRTPTEQVKAPSVGTGSSTTTATAPRDQEGR